MYQSAAPPQVAGEHARSTDRMPVRGRSAQALHSGAMALSRRSLRRVAAVAALVAALVGPAGGAGAAPAARDAATAADPAPPDVAVIVTREPWEWPVAAPFRLARAFVAPPHAYGPGHRGIDVDPLGAATARAPAGGVIAFSGQVAGRGVVTIDHGDGLVTTLEPVVSELEPGAAVARGDDVGDVARGGHAAPGALHFGVRLLGEYVNPLLLLGGVPRAVLLPCC